MSQQTQPPAASTADGNLFLTSRRKKGFLSRIRREPDGQSTVSSANSPTKAAQQPTACAPPLTRTMVNADRGGTQDRQGVAKGVPSKHPRHEQRRSDVATAGHNPAEKRPEKPPMKEQIDGIDAELYHRLVKEIGTPARRKKQINSALAEKMRRAGWSYRQVAQHFGVSPCTVRRRLKEAKFSR